ncbi:hypothetical protein LINGRAHAP2_LOCUS28632 [Linum grandiflorum]
MRSGHFPSEGYGKAAWFKELEYMDENGFFNHANVTAHVTKHYCYDILVENYWDDEASWSW